MGVKDLRRRMILAPTPRERERWYAILLLSQGLTAAATAEALERDPHTIGRWASAFGDGGPVPRQLYLPDSRRLVLPVHLLCLAPLPGCISPVAGDVKLEDHGVVHHPVDGRGGGHGVGKDALPLGEDQV